MAGIKREQAHRLLEDLETICLTCRLLQQAVGGFKRDMEGMLNGNKENGDVQGASPK
jgi:hypothetical protein